MPSTTTTSTLGNPPLTSWDAVPILAAEADSLRGELEQVKAKEAEAGAILARWKTERVALERVADQINFLVREKNENPYGNVDAADFASSFGSQLKNPSVYGEIRDSLQKNNRLSPEQLKELLTPFFSISQMEFDVDRQHRSYGFFQPTITVCCKLDSLDEGTVTPKARKLRETLVRVTWATEKSGDLLESANSVRRIEAIMSGRAQGWITFLSTDSPHSELLEVASELAWLAEARGGVERLDSGMQIESNFLKALIASVPFTGKVEGNAKEVLSYLKKHPEFSKSLEEDPNSWAATYKEAHEVMSNEIARYEAELERLKVSVNTLSALLNSVEEEKGQAEKFSARIQRLVAFLGRNVGTTRDFADDLRSIEGEMVALRDGDRAFLSGMICEYLPRVPKISFLIRGHLIRFAVCLLESEDLSGNDSVALARYSRILEVLPRSMHRKLDGPIRQVLNPLSCGFTGAQSPVDELREMAAAYREESGSRSRAIEELGGENRKFLE